MVASRPPSKERLLRRARIAFGAGMAVAIAAGAVAVAIAESAPGNRDLLRYLATGCVSVVVVLFLDTYVWLMNRLEFHRHAKIRT